VPGFVDVQVNGFAGVSFSACDREGFERAAMAMAGHGVTTFLPTIPTAAPDSYATSLAVAADAIARPHAGHARWGSTSKGRFCRRCGLGRTTPAGSSRRMSSSPLACAMPHRS
jgi:hypothetical protein